MAIPLARLCYEAAKCACAGSEASLQSTVDQHSCRLHKLRPLEQKGWQAFVRRATWRDCI
jgi:hypothetical protein